MKRNTCFSTNMCVFTVHVGADPADQLPGGSVPRLIADLLPGPPDSPACPQALLLERVPMSHFLTLQALRFASYE